MRQPYFVRLKLTIAALLYFFAVPAFPEVVMVSLQDGSEDKFGVFPIGREIYVDAIKLLEDNGAKAVIFKFFVDQSKNEAIENELRSAIAGVPVVMQAELNQGETVNNPEYLSTRNYPGLAIENLPGYRGGYFPLDVLSSVADSIGYANARIDENFSTVDLLSTYRGSIVPSMVLLTVEKARDETGRYQDDGLKIGDLQIPVSSAGLTDCEYLDSEDPPTYSFADLFSGSIGREDIEGNVVILGYARSNSPRIFLDRAKTMSLPVHQVFARQVNCILSISYK